MKQYSMKLLYQNKTEDKLEMVDKMTPPPKQEMYKHSEESDF